MGEAAGAGLGSAAVLGEAGAGQKNSLAGGQRAEDSTEVGAQLAGVRTASTAAVKVPVLTDLLLSLNVAEHGGRVLDGDLLPSLDVGLCHQVEGPVPEDVELGVADAAVRKEGEGWVESGVEAVSLAGHSQTDRVGLEDSHRSHHVPRTEGTGGPQAPGERLHCRHLPHLSQLGAGHDLAGVVHQHHHPAGRVRAGDSQPQQPHHVDEAHGRVGGLAQAEGDVDVEAGEEAALNGVVLTSSTVLVTDREVTVRTGESSPASQAVAALRAGLEVWSPDCGLLSEDGLAWPDVSGGHHGVAHPLPVQDPGRQAALAAPSLTVEAVVAGRAGAGRAGRAGHLAGGPA